MQLSFRRVHEPIRRTLGHFTPGILCTIVLTKSCSSQARDILISCRFSLSSLEHWAKSLGRWGTGTNPGFIDPLCGEERSWDLMYSSEADSITLQSEQVPFEATHGQMSNATWKCTQLPFRLGRLGFLSKIMLSDIAYISSITYCVWRIQALCYTLFCSWRHPRTFSCAPG